MRVGIISPNLIDSVDEVNALHDDPNASWLFDRVAKNAAFLFDKLYLTEDVEETCELIQTICPEDRVETLRYLREKGLLLTPRDLGYPSASVFLKENTCGCAAKLQTKLVRVGNPGLGEDDDHRYLGQLDIGDWAAQNGWHPRSRKGWNDPRIKLLKQKYESILLRRNAAILREAGLSDVAIVGRLHEERWPIEQDHLVWKVVLKEMPQLDTRAPWEDVFGFRGEERTQHLVRCLRRWVRKVVAEEFTSAELEDEIRELIFEYDSHMRLARLRGGAGVFEFLITGAAEFAEDVIKLRFGKLAKLATAVLNRRVQLDQAEAQAPGRELALIPELKQRF
jgi:hypothetical protein